MSPRHAYPTGVSDVECAFVTPYRILP